MVEKIFLRMLGRNDKEKKILDCMVAQFLSCPLGTRRSAFDQQSKRCFSLGFHGVFNFALRCLLSSSTRFMLFVSFRRLTWMRTWPFLTTKEVSLDTLR